MRTLRPLRGPDLIASGPAGPDVRQQRPEAARGRHVSVLLARRSVSSFPACLFTWSWRQNLSMGSSQMKKLKPVR